MKSWRMLAHVDRAEYTRATRQIQDETERLCDDLVRHVRTRPWRIGSTFAALTTEMQGCIERLRALDPPAGDRTELERHFLGPLQAEIEPAVEAMDRLRRDLRRLRFRTAFKRLDDFDELDGPKIDPRDREWCVAYGLEPAAPSPRSWFGPTAPIGRDAPGPNQPSVQNKVGRGVWMRGQSRQFVGWVVFWQLLYGATPAVLVSAPFWAHHQPFWPLVALAALGGVVLVALLVRAFRILTAGLLIADDEVIVRGIYRTRRIPVGDVRRFEEWSDYWARLSTQSIRIRLRSRGKVRVTAFQSPPYGGSAPPRWTEVVSELNALVAADGDPIAKRPSRPRSSQTTSQAIRPPTTRPALISTVPSVSCGNSETVASAPGDTVPHRDQVRLGSRCRAATSNSTSSVLKVPTTSSA